MGLRRFDFECSKCTHVHDDMIDVPMEFNKKKYDAGEPESKCWQSGTPPKRVKLECKWCGEMATHTRLLSAPAQYLYDRPYPAEVYGGKYDTEGYRQVWDTPKLPADADFDQARDILGSKKWQEKKKEKWDVNKQNMAKRQRRAAMRKHPTMNMRNTPLPGDPKTGPLKD